MMSRLWLILGAVGAALLAVIGIFNAGARSKANEMKAELNDAALKQKDKVREAERKGREKETEVRNAEKPADYDRYG